MGQMCRVALAAQRSPGWGLGGGVGRSGHCGFRGLLGTELVAQRVHTCAGTCVWCLEVGVRVTWTKECAYVCEESA